MAFPVTRMRRYRATEQLREMLSETVIRPSKLIQPLFVDERLRKRRELKLMPGQHVYPVGEIGRVASAAEKSGIRAVLLFGIPKSKDAKGSGAYARDGVVQKAISKIKEDSGAVVAADLCMCEYTSNGQCGITSGDDVDNDSTLAAYSQIALSQAEAGADIIAPSGMMDGQVAAIRRTLDDGGFSDRMIMAYASKSSSSFYGPFREAAESSPRTGNRKGYQLNYANARESIREIQLDAEEGADILMVKPALPNLDLILRARRRFDHPLAAYSVSGEYSMIRAASAAGMIDYRSAVLEVATSIFRAGADMLITYNAKEIAEWLR